MSTNNVNLLWVKTVPETFYFLTERSLNMNSEVLSEWSAITEQNLLSWSWTVSECWVWRGKGKHEHKVHSKLHWYKKKWKSISLSQEMFYLFLWSIFSLCMLCLKAIKNMLTIKSNHFHFIFVRIVKSGKPSVNVLRMNMFFFMERGRLWVHYLKSKIA